MRIAFFSTKAYEKDYFRAINFSYNHQLEYFSKRLCPETAHLAAGYPAVCCHVNDKADRETLDRLKAGGTQLLALRSSGYNHVDLERANELGIVVTRVPAYSPHAIAEHAVGMILSLNRRIHIPHERIQNDNLSLEGLTGFDLNTKTVGVIGTGEIGEVFAKIMTGFGCRVLAYSRKINPTCQAMGVEYVDLPELYNSCDIISLHCALTEDTYHLINRESINQMKPGVMLINTSRGAVIDTQAAIEGLANGQLGYLGLDVYEYEAGLFYRDWSNEGIPDTLFNQTKAMPNVLITGHQAYLTQEAMNNIAHTTLSSISDFEQDKEVRNRIDPMSALGHPV